MYRHPELASLSLADIAEMVEAQKLPPVDQWEPEETGDSEMRIAVDGTWYHQGSPIKSASHGPRFFYPFAAGAGQ